jgi:hypothetical protein
VFERQLATLRAEIERMQAERQAFDNRAVFSSVFFSLREEVSSPAAMGFLTPSLVSLEF